MTIAADTELYRIPLYTQPQAATIVDVRPETLRNWARGYAYKTLGGVVEAFPMITTSGSGTGRGPTVPFLGLAEAYVLAAFRAAGVPMQRIRPAIRWLDEHIGLPAALASERLRTDGAEILYDFGRGAADGRVQDDIGELVVVRNQQRVFAPLVSRYLQTISYGHGYVELIRLPRYEQVHVTVDPRINSGRPTVARRGIRVADVVSRLAAGEPDAQVADDYRLSVAEVRALTTDGSASHTPTADRFSFTGSVHAGPDFAPTSQDVLNRELGDRP